MIEILFSRTCSVAEHIEHLIQNSTASIDAALYRFDNKRLARALADARKRSVAIRLVLDRGRYQQTKITQELLETNGFAFRLLNGRQEEESKMHHKFAVLDGRMVLTGSYNWTLASEEQNYENLAVIQQTEYVQSYQAEFDALWKASEQI